MTLTTLEEPETLITTSALLAANALSIFPAVIYCDGAIVEGPNPEKRRVEAKKLEKAYCCAIKKCDPDSEPSCRCESTVIRDNSRETALITQQLAPLIIRSSNRELRAQIEACLNKINERWTVYVGSADVVLAFKRGTTEEKRLCVAREIKDEVIKLEAKFNIIFAECPCACEIKPKCKPKKGRRDESSGDESSFCSWAK